MVHSEVMLFELMRLYVHSTKEDSIDLVKLENAFYTFQELIGNQLGIYANYTFREELSKLEDLSEGIIKIDEDEITIFDENYLNLLDQQIEESLENGKSYFDRNLPDYIHNICLYKALDIKPPLDQYQDMIDLCFTIINNYQFLAFRESKSGNVPLALINFLKSLVDQYKEKYALYRYEDIDKIRVVLAYLNDLYLLDGDSDFINSNWYVVLFGHDEKQKFSLAYDRLFHSVNSEDLEYSDLEEQDDEEEEMEDELGLDDLIREATYLDNETDFFLSYYTVLFNQALKQIENQEVKDILTSKKYLLVAIQPGVEDYFFQNMTIDSFPLPELKPEWITDSLFTSFYLPVVECIPSFQFRDSDINSECYANIVTSAIFIKSFLNLCPNKEKVEDVKIRICNPNFYKNEEYSIATHLIDDFIFKDPGMELTRNME